MTLSASLTPTPPPIDDLQGWLAGFTEPTVGTELAALAACILLAWGLTAVLRRALGMKDESTSVLFGHRLVDGVMFPLLLLTAAYTARGLLLSQQLPLAVFRVAIPVLVSLVGRTTHVGYPRGDEGVQGKAQAEVRGPLSACPRSADRGNGVIRDKG